MTGRSLQLGTPSTCKPLEFDVRHDKVAISSGCESHPATLLPPEATGAVMEETKWLKPSV